MFRVISVCLAIITSVGISASAQTSRAENIHWFSSLDSAKKEASVLHKNIFLYFSGSDWCKPCIKLREMNINTPVFKQFASDRLVMLLADFPRLKKNRLTAEQARQNEAMAELYDKEGIFPLIVILDQEGKTVAKVGYNEEGPQDFVSSIQNLLNQ